MTNIIKLVKALFASDGNVFQTIRCRFQDRDQDLKVLNSYGHSFNPPDNSFGVALAVSGYESDVHVIVDKPEIRFTGLAKGEVKDGNFVEGSYVYYKADGSIEIKPKTGQVVNVIGDVVVTGTVTAANFITASVSDYNAHTHSGVETGPGNTGGPN